MGLENGYEHLTFILSYFLTFLPLPPYQVQCGGCYGSKLVFSLSLSLGLAKALTACIGIVGTEAPPLTMAQRPFIN